MTNKTGLTKDAGWQVGIRKTMPSSLDNIWNAFFSEEGSKLWDNGVNTNFSTFKPHSHIRTKWKHQSFKESANLQIRFIPSVNNDKTTIAIHVDQLENEDQREEAKKYWSKIIDALASLLTTSKQI